MSKLLACGGGLVKDPLSLLKDLELWRLVLVFVSALTTFIGMLLLYDSFAEGGGNFLIGLLRFVIPPALAGGLHAIIYSFLQQGAELRRYRGFLYAVPFQLVAIFGSFGAHWMHMRGDSYTVADFDRAQTAIMRGIGAFMQSYQTLGAATAALAEHSVLQARNEAEGPGDSCGTRVGTGRGPRYELRIADRDVFSGLNRDLAPKVKQLEALVKRAQEVGADTLQQVRERSSQLRRLVNEAKMFEADPLLIELHKIVQARIEKGHSGIKILPEKRTKIGPVSFVCPDPALERHLTAVADAIATLKPVPEADFKDATDLRVGASVAWRRLLNTLLGSRIAAYTRDEQRAARVEELHGAGEQSEKLTTSDAGPLAIACAVEFGLTLLFLCAGGGLPSHPGLAHLREVLQRPRQQVFDSVWAALGGAAERGTVRRALHRFTKFEGSSTLVIVPVYSEDHDVQVLHQLMHLLANVGLARRIYSGYYAKQMFGLGWTSARRAEALGQGAVRVYRMSSAEYLALIVDALHGGGESTQACVDEVARPEEQPPADASAGAAQRAA